MLIANGWSVPNMVVLVASRSRKAWLWKNRILRLVLEFHLKVSTLIRTTDRPLTKVVAMSKRIPTDSAGRRGPQSSGDRDDGNNDNNNRRRNRGNDRHNDRPDSSSGNPNMMPMGFPMNFPMMPNGMPMMPPGFSFPGFPQQNQNQDGGQNGQQ